MDLEVRDELQKIPAQRRVVKILANPLLKMEELL